MMISERMKKHRLKKGISISELANRTGISRSYLTSIEKNEQLNPSAYLLEEISEALGVAPETFITSEVSIEGLGEEWVQLVKELMESGISKEQFQHYI